MEEKRTYTMVIGDCDAHAYYKYNDGHVILKRHSHGDLKGFGEL